MIQAKKQLINHDGNKKQYPKNFGKNGNSSQPLKNTEIRKNTEEQHVCIYSGSNIW